MYGDATTAGPPTTWDLLTGSTASGPVTAAAGAVGGFFAGREMAPTEAEELTYGLVGAVVGATPILRLFGLGVLGYYALREQGE